MSTLVIRRGINKTAAVEDGPSLEVQFGTLANANIVEKYPKLDRMRLAFQLIETEDGNRKAVGAAVYVVGRTVIFIPAFYKNGSINTGDMMFLPSTQQFLPLSDPWLAWIQSKDLPEAGASVDTELVDTGLRNSSVPINGMLDPIIKTGSLYLKGLLHTAKDLTKAASGTNIFDAVIGMGKEASAAMLNTLIKDNRFLNASLRFYTGDELLAFSKRASEFGKERTVQRTAKLVLPFTKEAAVLNREERAHMVQDGFIIKSAVDEADSPDVIRADGVRDSFAQVSKPGKYKLLTMDGAIWPCLVMRKVGLKYRNECFKVHPEEHMTYGAPGSASQLFSDMDNTLVAITSTSASRAIDLKPNTMRLISMDDRDITADLISSYGIKLSPSSCQEFGWGDVILCPDGCAYSIASTLFANDNSWYSLDGKSLIIGSSPSQTSPVITETCIIMPKGCRVLKEKMEDEAPAENESGTEDVPGELDVIKESVKKSSPFPFVTLSFLDVFLNAYRKKHYNTVKLTSNGNEAIVSGDSETTGAVSLKEASLHLVNDYGVHPSIARSMLKDTVAGSSSTEMKSVQYWISKKAAGDDPWEDAAIPMSETENVKPDVDKVQMPAVIEDPGKLEQTVAMAAQEGIKEVFDVTALKILIRQNRFLEDIHKDIPVFMRVLDSLCRKLFMLYWHTEAFEDAYGTVKLKAIEDGIKTAIDSLSELTVFFKLRNPSGDTGIGQDGGDLMRGYDI